MAKAKKRPVSATSRAAPTRSGIAPWQIGLVVVAALLIVGGLILLGNQARGVSRGGPVDMSQFPTLGEADAPVTVVEYSDYG